MIEVGSCNFTSVKREQKEEKEREGGGGGKDKGKGNRERRGGEVGEVEEGNSKNRI